MPRDLVSVVTITRNRGPLLKRCITSILDQTYANIEVILVDGASTDNTDEVVSSFNDDRVKYIKLKENLPVIETWNFAIKNCSGKFISFLDSDDEYELSKIEKQVNLINSLTEDYGMVYCWMRYIDSQSKKTIKIHNPKLRGFVGNEVVAKPIVSGTPSFLFRADALRISGGWKSEIGMVSDWELAVRFCQNWKVDFVPEPLVKVFVNHNLNQMTSTSYYENLHERIIIFHNYFLIEFSNVFENYPNRKEYHLLRLVYSYTFLGMYKKAWLCYYKLLTINLNFKNIFYPFSAIIKKYKF